MDIYLYILLSTFDYLSNGITHNFPTIYDFVKGKCFIHITLSAASLSNITLQVIPKRNIITISNHHAIGCNCRIITFWTNQIGSVFVFRSFLSIENGAAVHLSRFWTLNNWKRNSAASSGANVKTMVWKQQRKTQADGHERQFVNFLPILWSLA